VTVRPPEPDRRRAGATWRAAAGVLAFSVAVVAGLQAFGRLTRTHHGPPAQVLVVANGRAALRAWRERHERGRVLVHAGRFLHFIDDARAEDMKRALTAPGHGGDLDELLLRTAAPGRYLWIAASIGMVRQIVYVSPPAALDERLGQLGWSRDGLPADLTWEVFPRTLAAAFPKLDEPVILEICASWFDDPRAPDPLGQILASGLEPDLVVVNLAEDSPDVSDRAREEARSLGATLGARLTKGRR
jgi:hypothetical protein